MHCTERHIPMGIVAKFGGSSLADAKSVRNVAQIIQSNPEIDIVVVSAPGKRYPTDEKVTDLLLQLWGLKPPLQTTLRERILERFVDIITEVHPNPLLEHELDELLESVSRREGSSFIPRRELVVSRGEYAMARVMANVLDWTFVDAADFICFDRHHDYDAESTMIAFKKLPAQTKIVVPGFYGACAGEIVTFSRGGSDITGAIMAQLSRAQVYENWTDVCGVLAADPNSVHEPESIRTMTYEELRELSYRGARVLHEDALAPVRASGIPVNVRSTQQLSDPGTWIVKELDPAKPRKGSIVGIAGKDDFVSFTLKKPGMGRERGFYLKVCGVFDTHQINIEHLPGGIDTQSVIIDASQLEGRTATNIQRQLMTVCKLPSLPKVEKLALICIVGETMSHKQGIAARAFTALSKARINVNVIDQGSSEINIIIGVAEADLKRAINAIYKQFFQ